MNFFRGSTMHKYIRSAKLEDCSSIQKIYAPIVADTPISFEMQVPDTAEIISRMGEITRLLHSGGGHHEGAPASPRDKIIRRYVLAWASLSIELDYAFLTRQVIAINDKAHESQFGCGLTYRLSNTDSPYLKGVDGAKSALSKFNTSGKY